MKKICIVFNHFQVEDGVCRAAINMANKLAEFENVEITLRPLFKFDKKMLENVSPKVKVRKVFGFYFRGFSRLLKLIPQKLLYKVVFDKDYDIEIGYCMSAPIRIVAHSFNKKSRKFAWMHGYDEGITLRDSYSKCDKVICVSKCNAERLKIEAPELSVDYCYNLIDDNIVKALGKESCDIEKKAKLTLVSVGRMSPEKGFDRLIKAVANVANVELWLIGAGPIQAELKELASSLNVLDRILFLGVQTNPHKYTSKADLFVCSSLSEGYSTSCTEAVMLGIPVLSTNVSGAKEIIELAESGLVVDNNEESLYEAILDLSKNPEQILQWKQILKRTRENFSVENKIKKIKEVLDV